MRQLVTLAALAAVALSTAACGTTALNNLTQNQACTTRVSGKLAFGSITPTGTLNVTATCKPADTSPPVSEVKAPAAPDEAASPPT